MIGSGDLVSGRYRLDKPIGSGGMATVWRARDEVTGQDVALKRMHARVQDDPDLIERFRREAQVVARLSHPSVVRLLDEGEDDDGPYIVFELVEGTNLKALIRSRGALSPELAASITSQVARGLELAHRSGVVHRDIKSHNVLVADDGTAKLTDFGIARLLDGDQGGLTRTGTVLGTSDYLAPEQARGLRVDGRTDVYSLGIVVYECLTGQLPFPADTPMGVAQRQVRDPMPDPRDVQPGIPPHLASVVLRACEKDPSARFGSALEMSDALLDVPLDATGVMPVITATESEEVTGALAVTPGSVVPLDDGDTQSRPVVPPDLPPALPPSTPPPPAAQVPEVEPSRDPDAEVFVAQSSGRRRVWPGAVAALLIVALAGVGAFIVWRGTGSDAGNVVTQAASSASQPTAPPTDVMGAVGPLQLASVKDVDPGGEGREMSGEVPLAYDGNEETAWRTERYATADFGGVDKTGVGLTFTLQQPSVATRMNLITKGTGGTFQVLAGPPATDARVVGEGTFGDGRQSVDLTPGAASGIYTLWITSLPPNILGGGYRAYVAEASFEGTVPEG